MKRLAVSSVAVAGVFTLGLAGASILAPSAGAATPFVAGHPAAHTPAVSPNAKVKSGSTWTLNIPGVGCNVETFAAGNVVTTDTGFTGTWIKPTGTTLALVYPNVATFVGTYSSSLGDYSGKVNLAGSGKYPGSSLTPGATSGC